MAKKPYTSSQYRTYKSIGTSDRTSITFTFKETFTWGPPPPEIPATNPKSPSRELHETINDPPDPGK